MAVEILTKEDLNDFRILLLDDIREILQGKTEQTKQWLKSKEVRKLLNITHRRRPLLQIISNRWPNSLVQKG